MKIIMLDTWLPIPIPTSIQVSVRDGQLCKTTKQKVGLGN